jgi:hypothetical protein
MPVTKNILNSMLNEREHFYIGWLTFTHLYVWLSSHIHHTCVVHSRDSCKQHEGGSCL